MPSYQRILVTSALPYANGPIHFGHIVGAYLPADVFVRYHRLKGSDVVYICGTDEHGVAITIAARREGVAPRALVDRYHGLIKDIFDRVNIRFDNFSRTSRPLNHRLSQRFFLDLYEGGHITERTERQLYCPKDRLFLADRYVEGTCPACGAEGARGDECPRCGKWLDPLLLKDPRCAVCGTPPEPRETRNWYLKLQDFEPRLRAWIDSKRGYWKENVLRFVDAMFQEGLRERCITRDLDWGVPVPLPEAEGKVLYVWFDAPIGYVSSTIEWAEAQGDPERWRAYWQDPACRLVHFIGKDNIPFHCVVFPAMLMGQKEPYILPDNVPANEFYNLQGDKFNTSRGWYIDPQEFLQKYPVDALRYMLAATAPETRDTEFTWEEFQKRVNTELADTLGNLVTRSLKFIAAYMDGRVPEPGPLSPGDQELLGRARKAVAEVGHLYDTFRLRAAVEASMGLAREANRYLNEKAPWHARKENPEGARTTLYVAAQVVRTLALLFHPVMPETTETLWRMCGFATPLAGERWDGFAEARLPPGHRLGQAEPLFQKLEDRVIQEEIAALRARAQAAQEKAGREPAVEPIKSQIDYSEFGRVDMRVGRVLEAEDVPDSKKLLRLVVDLGVEKRQVIAGIKGYYEPARLVGRKVILLANLAPRKMMGLESQGMVLAAEGPEGEPYLLFPDGDPPVGAKVL